VAAGTGIVKSLPNEVGTTAMALLESNGRVEYIPAIAGTFARANHSQTTTTFGALMFAKEEPEIVIFNLFLKTGYPHLDPLEAPQ